MEVVVQRAQRWLKSFPLGPVIVNGLFSWIPTNCSRLPLGCGLKALPHVLGTEVTHFTTSELECTGWEMEFCPDAVHRSSRSQRGEPRLDQTMSTPLHYIL